MSYPNGMNLVRTPLLEVACEVHGKEDGNPIILLHGWPDSGRTWDRVVPSLVDAGYRVHVPWLRGTGRTRFLDTSTRRAGQPTALAQDVIDLADALGLARFQLVGHDWGAVAAYFVAAHWPQRVERLVALSVGYGVSSPNQIVSLPQARNFWYQWVMQTEQGELLIRRDRRAWCRFIWQTWMPTWHFDEALFESAAPDWDNPDWIAVTLQYYRQRWGNALSDPHYDNLEIGRLVPKIISVPTRVLHGQDDGCVLPSMGSGSQQLFSGPYERILLDGVGHFPQYERPLAVINAILDRQNS